MAAPLPPSLPTRSLLGHWSDFRKDPLALLERAAALRTDAVRTRMVNQTVTLLCHPDAVKHVLQDHVKNYTKDTLGYAQLKKLLGNGLVTSEGSFWLRQRRIAQPAFHRKHLADFARTMSQLTGTMLEGWDKLAPGTQVDAAAEMMALTLRIVGQTLLSTDVTESSTVGQALTPLLEQMIHRTTDLVQLPLAIPTRSNRIFVSARATLDRMVLGMVKQRRATDAKARPADLLTMLMDAKDEDTGETMTDVQLRDEVMTIFLAGHETTANALAWTFHLLGANPQVLQKLQGELDAVLGGRLPQFEDMPKLAYTARVVNESMRLFPPIWVLARAVVEDDEVRGFKVEKGTYVMVSPWVLHRDGALWPDPLKFDPDRFLPDAILRQPRFAYFPFSGGPRQCIGNNFALTEATLILAGIAQRYVLEPVPGYQVVPQPTVTLRPRQGLRMTLTRRSPLSSTAARAPSETIRA